MQQRKKMNISFHNKTQALKCMERIYGKIKSSDIILNVKNNNVEVRIFDLETKKKIAHIVSKIRKEMG